MKKLVLTFATIIACISAVNAQTQQQNGVLNGQRGLQTSPIDTSRRINTTTPATPTTPQSVTPGSTTPTRTSPIGSPTQPGNPLSPNTTTPGTPPNPSDRNIR